ncbi:MAG: LamG domain-containing protein [Bacteroidetes bacterium]|nr:LamG domain-containing protein [Bacteroidota bacterium]
MKLLVILLATLTSIFFISGCDQLQENDLKENGKVRFSFSPSASGSLKKSAADSTQISGILITLTDTKGKILSEKQFVSVIKFGSGYVSEPIELASGAYLVTEFFVENSNNEIVYATPVKDSHLAHLVTTPLPATLSVEPDIISNLSLEVLEVNNSAPSEFGYASFHFNVVRYSTIQVGVFVFDSTSGSFVLTNAEIAALSGETVLGSVESAYKTAVLRVKIDPSLEKISIRVRKLGFEDFVSELSKNDFNKYSVKPLTVILKGQITTGSGNYLILDLPFDQSVSNSSSIPLQISVFGDPVFTTGKHGTAIKLDGIDDYIEIKNNPELNPKSITLTVWVNVHTSFYGIGNNTIIDKPYSEHNDPYYQYHLGISGDEYGSGSGYSTFGFSICGNEYGIPLGTSNGFWQTGKWYMVTATFDDQTKRSCLYVDGKLIVSQIKNISVKDMGQNLFIGRFGNLTYAFTPIILDDLRIYNYALSSQEIATLANQ